MVTINLNGARRELDVEDDMPLLWVLRDELGLTGTKFGCGVAACGACTVWVDGVPTRSCVMPVGAVQGPSITTIEGANGPLMARLQAAWVAHQVPQCGYCQSGMLMAAAALLREKPQPNDADIEAALTNLCRCGTYQRIRAAIHAAVSPLPGDRA